MQKAVNRKLLRMAENQKNDGNSAVSFDGNSADKNTGIREFVNCSIRALEGEGNERKFRLSFASEEPYERWFGKEILSHAEGAVDLHRLNSIGCVLFNHDKDRVIAKVHRAWIENNRCEAEIEFDSDADSEVIYQKVKSGTLKGVSVGYVVSKWEEVRAGETSKDGRFVGPCSIAIEWMPYEISIVSIPADATVGVGRSKESPTPPEQQKGVSSFYYYEKQLQINKNLLNLGGRQNES